MTSVRFFLNIRIGDARRRVVLEEGPSVLGRDADCDVVLDEPSVSRRHARIDVTPGGAVLHDLGSHNGTRLNDRLVVDAEPLSAGDRVLLGRASLLMGEPGGSLPLLTVVEETAPGIAVDWSEIASEPRRADARSRLFGVLARSGALLTARLTPDQLYAPILDLVDDAVAPARALIVLLDAESDEPRVRASRVRDDVGSREVTLSRAVVDRVLGERTSFLIEDALDDDALRSRASILRDNVRTAMAAPLFDNNEVIGLLYADSDAPDRPYTTDELRTFTLLANVVAVALTEAHFRDVEKEKRRLESELEAARRIMTTLLPDGPPEVPGYATSAYLEPCTEVGGDLHDCFIRVDGRRALVVGDASGKGLGAALVVSSLLPLVRGLFETADADAVVPKLNELLWRTTDSLSFATLVLGALDPASGRLEYVNAGHNPPLLLRRDGTLEPLAATGTPVALLPDGSWHAETATLEPGDCLVLYSDGIPEAWNDDEVDYGDERLRAVLSRCAGRPPDEIRNAVLTDVKTFLAGADPSDDMTLVLVRRDD